MITEARKPLAPDTAPVRTRRRSTIDVGVAGSTPVKVTEFHKEHAPAVCWHPAAQPTTADHIAKQSLAKQGRYLFHLGV